MPAFVKVTLFENQNANHVTGATFSATSGNALFACTHTYNASTSAGTITVSGGGSTSWTNDATGTYVESGTNHGDLAITSTPTNTGGTNSISTNDSVVANSGAGVVFVIYEFSGMASSSMLDAAGTLKTGTSSTPSTNSLTNTNASDVFIALMGEGGGSGTITGSQGSGGGTWTFPAGAMETNGSLYPCASAAYNIVSATGAQNPSWTLGFGSTPWATTMACYKAAGGAAAVQPMLSLLGCGP